MVVTALKSSNKLSNQLLLLFLSILSLGYLSQYWDLSPNTADGALLLDYIHSIAQGSWPYWDFVDAYGPLNWLAPTSAYVLAGEKVWGIRLWLIVLKWLCVLIGTALTLRLSSTLYAAGTLVGMTLFLGLPWQYFQTAYSFHHALPWLLGAWWLLVDPSPHHYKKRLVLAGIATAWVFWTKINTGVFLFAAGLAYCWFWIPCSVKTSNPANAKPSLFFKGLLVTSIVLILGVFTLFIWEHLNQQYFIYLLMPLGLYLFEAFKAQQPQWAQLRFKYAVLYGLSTLLPLMAFWLGYYQDHALLYFKELFTLLGQVHYAADFPPIAEETLYPHFNRYYWLHLPWLMIPLWGVWRFAHGTHRWPDSAQDDTLYRNTMGLWGMVTLNMFVIYSRSDETHLIQGIIPFIPLLFVLLWECSHTLSQNASTLKSRWRQQAFYHMVCLGGLALWGKTLFYWNMDFSWKCTSHFWQSSRLACMKMTDPKRRILAEWDLSINEVSEYLSPRVSNDEEVLVLTQDLMVNYNSETVSPGGRFRYLWYLVKSHLLQREGFEAVVPSSVLETLLQHPPKYLIGGIEQLPIFREFPEIKKLLQQHYEPVAQFRRLVVYERQ